MQEIIGEFNAQLLGLFGLFCLVGMIVASLVHAYMAHRNYLVECQNNEELCNQLRYRARSGADDTALSGDDV